MHALLAAIQFYLPSQVLDTAKLSGEFPEWSVEKLDRRIGVNKRHIAGANEFASDIAVAAGERLFASGVCRPEDVDFLLFCTQTSDTKIPTTACVVQHRLGIPKTSGAFDIGLGCSGYVYGLGVAEALVVSGQAGTVLLITADTYSKIIPADDKSLRCIFGDGASASLVVGTSSKSSSLGPFMYGSDGSGAGFFHLENHASGTSRNEIDSTGRVAPRLVMNGSAMFDFALQTVPKVIAALLDKAALTLRDIDLIVCHQANAYILESIRDIIGADPDRFFIDLRESANTVSSTIPIALTQAYRQGKIKPTSVVLLVGFGVGLSWAATLIRWSAEVDLWWRRQIQL